MSIKWYVYFFLFCTFNIILSAPRFRPYYIEPTVPAYQMTYQMTIMIDPAGDAHYVGRKIEDCFERGLTLQCAEWLKKRLEEEYPGLRILLTRTAGETVQLLQNANFANRLNVDLYLSIHFYQELSAKPKLYLYHFSYGNDMITKIFDFCFYPYDQAYLFSKEQTIVWAEQIKQILCQDTFSFLFDVHGPYALPFKPLIGIKSPAIAIEAGFKHATDWKQLSEPLVASLRPIIMTYQKKSEEV